MKYVWHTPRFQGRADAQSVGESLDAIEKRDGHMAPAVVVAEASDPSSPLHSCFTWDDGEAARKHRETEARALVRSIRIEVRIKGGGKQIQRKWVNIEIKKGVLKRAYVSINRLGRNEAVAEEIMEEAMRGLRQWADRYDELRARLPGVFEAIDEVLAEQE